MFIMRWSVGVLTLLGTAVSLVKASETPIHEAGRCAIRGQCGKKSLFGGNLPCVDNGLAKDADASSRQKLVSLCGDKWSNTPVCCDEEQLDALGSNLKLVSGIISSCPACKDNFYNLFCTFTCSPNQSLFVNVTEAEKKGDKKLVTELDNWWKEDYERGFYESCKNVKNGASGGQAMDFIGGGAKDYQHFLKFLGDKKPFGSPFQMNFLAEPRTPGRTQGMKPPTDTPRFCDDPDPKYRCSCVDCPNICPELPPLEPQKSCHVGFLPCISFAMILVYSVVLFFVVLAVIGHGIVTQRQRKLERLRLLEDVHSSDDEFEDDYDRYEEIIGGFSRPSRPYKLNGVFDVMFSRVGAFCAAFPAVTITISILLTAFLSLGWLNFSVETDPVKLWVSPSSAAAGEKAFFDQNFDPFYRAEQVFVTNDTHPGGPGPVLSYDTLNWWFDVERRVHRLKSISDGLSLEDLCLMPTGHGCVVQSLSGYFGGSSAILDPSTWAKHIAHCANSPGAVECLPEFQQPLQPNYILGGYDETGNVLDAKAFVVTWVVNNYIRDSQEETKAIRWENSLKSLLSVAQEEATERGLRLSFSTEVSLEQELNKTTNTDAKIVMISYIIMFIYVAFSLGSTTLTWRTFIRNPANTLIQSKFTLSVVGIAIVLMSVSASVGLFSAFGVKVTLIIAEVIPFLVLAVGVDNIFLIVHELERVNMNYPNEEIVQRISRALGRMGPSILLSSLTETVAFAIGAFVGMPAVRNFAIYATGAVIINAFLQTTMFVAVLALNQRRVESNRADCFPCFVMRGRSSSGMPGGQVYADVEESSVQRFVRRTYAGKLLDSRVKSFVMIIFFGIFAASLALLPGITLGLDQRIAIPEESHLIPYFDDLYDYFDTGPPVYFVTRGVNVTSRHHQQQLCGRFTSCDEFSLSYILEQESKRSNVSYISGATANWLDDFFYWLNPQQDCCIEDDMPCFEDRNPPWNISLYGMPEGNEFIHYAKMFLKSPTDETCPLGGMAPYGDALVLAPSETTIRASHFRTSHTPLRSQDDFIKAYASARRIADGISKEHDIDVFPYSKFYIFFDQYTSIVGVAATSLGSALGLIFLITSVFLGSIATGAVVALTVLMMVTGIMGTMAVFGVSLNAVSLVNLIISVGIGFEFCAHIARAFMFPSRSLLEKARLKYNNRSARAWTALVNVGGSVFTGITVTKLLGVSVLAFTRSKIFDIYYFRVWLALVIYGASHALIFLPVALSFVGGEGYTDPYAHGGLEEDLAERRYRSIASDDEYDSDEY